MNGWRSGKLHLEDVDRVCTSVSMVNTTRKLSLEVSCSSHLNLAQASTTNSTRTWSKRALPYGVR